MLRERNDHRILFEGARTFAQGFVKPPELEDEAGIPAARASEARLQPEGGDVALLRAASIPLHLFNGGQRSVGFRQVGVDADCLLGVTAGDRQQRPGIVGD
jgi:hypothetical protein